MFTKRVSTLFCFVFLFCCGASAADFYVSPTGSSSGDGSLANPWDLKTALAHPASVQPGDTIWIRGGRYVGTYGSGLRGTASAPIVVRNYAGERVIIDGTRAGQSNKYVTVFSVWGGGYVWFQGLEITNSDPQRTISVTGSNPPEARGAGFLVQVPGVKAINLLIYDTGQGITAYKYAVDFEAYGNVVFNNGWDAPDRTHGHGIYTQNDTGTKVFAQNVVTHQFGDAIHVYGSSTAPLKNFNFTENMWLNGRVLYGGGQPLINLNLDSEILYNTALDLGYTSVGSYATSVTNSYIISAAIIKGFNELSFKNNTVYGLKMNNAPFNMATALPSTPTAPIVFDNNTYHQGNTATGLDFVVYPSTYYTFQGWQGLGRDINSRYIPAANRPTTPTIFLRKNKYDSNLAYLAIHNWSSASTVSVDPSSFLSIGDDYELHNVLDYFNDVITGTYNGSTITVPMINHTVALPLGYTKVLGANSFPGFGGFIFVKKPKTSGATVSVSPTSVTLTSGQSKQFSATVNGVSNTAVTWSISPAVGSISSTGLYTAPAAVTSAQTVTVKATSVAATSVSAAATVQLAPPGVGVTVTGASTTVMAGGSVQFSASVTGTTNTAVTWSISPTLGSISSSGGYTAPAVVTSPATIKVTATSVADPTKFGTASLSLVQGVAVSLTPSSVSLTPGKTQQFSASVTGSTNTAVSWSLSPAVGTVSSTGLYTAPSTVTSAQTVTLKATSQADTTKSASAVITLNPLSSSTANLVTDPGFETGGMKWMGKTNGGRSITTAQFRSGAYSQQITGSTTYPREVYQDVPVTPGQTVKAGVWIRTAGVVSGASVSLVWLNAAGLSEIPPASAVLRRDTVGTLTGSQAWSNRSLTAVAPANAKVVRVRLLLPQNPTTAVAHFDDITLQ